MLIVPSSLHAGDGQVVVASGDSRVRIEVGGKPFATYVYKDDKVRRPYFAHIVAPGGMQVSRNHPPVAGKDLADHADMHPGLWLAFGDLDSADFWRNRGSVEHAGFVTAPKDGRFAVRNRYRAGDRVVCEEISRFAILARPLGALLLWDSEFSSPRAFAFGDQEEMGLGFRVATPLAVKSGGRIVNSDGRKDERQVWGQQADWCAYEGKIEGKHVGVVLMPSPHNFRRAWFHARDYGLLVANPFGRRAFTRGDMSHVQVGPGEPLRLRFGVLVYTGEPDLHAAYRDYLRLSR